MTAAAPHYPGPHLPLGRAYGLRSASMQADEMDRNLMFYYEHLQLYDPNHIRRSSVDDETRAARRQARESRERRGAPHNVPLAPQPRESAETATAQDEGENAPSPSELPVCSELTSPVEEGPEQHVEEQHVEEESEQHATVEDPPPDYHPDSHPPAYYTIPESPLPDATICHPDLAENLRRFLIFCLAIDYDLVAESPEKLREADWLPFLRLAMHWSWRDSRRRYQQGYDPVRPAFLGNPSRADSAADDERALKVEQCIFACVVRPAQALNIPPDIAITMLRQFPESITSLGDYVPYFHRYRCRNTKSLATKLLLDREILFDTVTKREHWVFRSALHEANERVMNKNFVTLRSPDEYELTQHGHMREKLEGTSRAPSPNELDGDIGPKGRKRFSRWVRKLSSA